MRCVIEPFACGRGARLPLTCAKTALRPGHVLRDGDPPPGAGWRLLAQDGKPWFLTVGWVWTGEGAGAPLLEALTDIPDSGPLAFSPCKSGYAVAIVTLSDKGSLGLREDRAGPALADLLAKNLQIACLARYLLPDDSPGLRGLLASLALTQDFDLVCTAGGTGVSPRDITPEATAAVIDYALPGFGEAMRMKSLAKTPNAIVSRALCGVAGACLILNLPGSLAGATENLEAVLPALGHTLAKLGGDPADCGG